MSSRRSDPRPGWSAEDAERHLLSRERFGMRFGLDRMRRLLNVLELPTPSFPDRARGRAPTASPRRRG